MRKLDCTKTIYALSTHGSPIMDTNIQKFQAFVTTVDLGSFTKASEALSCSQSGISRMIGDIEKDWGVILLERGRSGIRLTADGEKLLPEIRALCESFERLQSSVDEINGMNSGTIKIGCISSVATHWLPKIVERFAMDYPDIKYEVILGDYTDIENWIAEGRVDFGFLRLPTTRNLDTMFLSRDPLMAVLPKNHPLAELDVVPIKELCKNDFLLVEKRATSDAGDLLKEHDLQPRIRFKTWDDYAVLALVEAGRGVTILSELVLMRNPFDVAIRPLDVPAHRNLGVCMRDCSSTSTAVRKFLGYLPLRDETVNTFLTGMDEAYRIRSSIDSGPGERGGNRPQGPGGDSHSSRRRGHDGSAVPSTPFLP